MKRWIFLAAILAVSIGILIYLFERGYMHNIKWENLTILFAALFAPVQMVFSWLKDVDIDLDGDDDEIEAENAQLKKDLQRSQELNASLAKDEERLKILEKEIQILQLKTSLDLKK